MSAVYRRVGAFYNPGDAGSGGRCGDQTASSKLLLSPADCRKGPMR
jgi:hypothetical protein